MAKLNNFIRKMKRGARNAWLNLADGIDTFMMQQLGAKVYEQCCNCKAFHSAKSYKSLQQCSQCGHKIFQKHIEI